MGLLQNDDGSLVLIGQLLGGGVVFSEPLGVQLEYVGSWVIFGSISVAAP